MERQPEQVAEELDPVLDFIRSIWALDHALQRASIRMEELLGVTAQQRFAIRLMGRLPGITPGRLATLLHVDRGSITALLRRLEARGLLSRKADTADRRRVFLRLTARGRKLDVATPVSVEHAIDKALKQSTAADVAAMRRILQRLVDALNDVAGT